MYRHFQFLLFTLALFGLAGCDSSTSSRNSGGGSMEQAAAGLDAQKAADQKDQERVAAAEVNQPPAAPQRTEAGRAPIGEGGYLTAIAGARRHVLNKVEDLAWTQAVQHFQATEGRLPKDHDEFMTRIIEPLGIDLGYKEEGQEFLYDPTPTEENPWGTVYVVEAAEAPAGQQP